MDQPPGGMPAADRNLAGRGPNPPDPRLEPG